MEENKQEVNLLQLYRGKRRLKQLEVKLVGEHWRSTKYKEVEEAGKVLSRLPGAVRHNMANEGLDQTYRD